MPSSQNGVFGGDRHEKRKRKRSAEDEDDDEQGQEESYQGRLRRRVQGRMGKGAYVGMDGTEEGETSADEL
jgi:hypothetical protein